VVPVSELGGKFGQAVILELSVAAIVHEISALDVPPRVARRKPSRYTFPGCCAVAASGAWNKLRATTTATPIRSIGTSRGWLAAV